MLPFIETKSGFQTIVNNKSYAVNKSHHHYDVLFSAVLDSDVDTFLTHYSKEQSVNNAFNSTGVEVRNGCVYYNSKELHGALIDRIINFTERELNTESMIMFLENLMNNPSARAVNELYNFLEHRGLPITNDGYFLAYKSVKSNYTDKYSGTIDNSVGQVVEIPRNEVDDEKSKTCSYGLHVGALEYSGPEGWYHKSGDKIMIVKINPADAVSVPSDHNAQKLRVCKYEVIGEYEQDLDNDYIELNSSDFEMLEDDEFDVDEEDWEWIDEDDYEDDNPEEVW